MRSIAVCLSAFFFALACATSPAIADEALGPSEVLGSVDAEEGAAPETENPLEGMQPIPSPRGTEETSSIAGNEADPIIPVDRADEVKLERVHAEALRDDALPSLVSSADPAPASTPSPAQAVAVYRLYNPSSGEHFYTHDAGEQSHLVAAGWNDEGTAWYAPASGIPVYRVYYAPTGEHHYTTDANERSVLLARGWKAEGILCYASTADGVPVYRQYNPRGGAGAHNFTTSKAENDSLVESGWRGEGIAFYVAGAGVPKARETQVDESTAVEDIYRLYLPASGEHFYTRDATEKSVLVKRGWYDEGIAWRSPVRSSKPVYRLYNRALGDHHYTTDANEVQVLTSRHGWKNEGVGWYSSENQEVAVYRQFNPGLVQGAHHYTTAKAEYDTNNARNGWRGEGIAWYAAAGGVPNTAHWQNPESMYQVSSAQVRARYPGKGAFSYVSPNKLHSTFTRNHVIEAFVGCALEYVGTKYVWDYALAPGRGVDCAGLVLQAMYAVGIDPERYTVYDHFYTPGHDHYANDMRADSKIPHVAFNERQRGDLLFYDGHVAIYLGNNQVVDARTSGVAVRSMNISGHAILAVGRLFR